MSKYINADKLKEHYAWWGEDSEEKRIIDEIVDVQPSADVVEVVRCKDCKHSKYREDYDDYECEASGCGLVNNADFYCADGERKETDDR